MSVNDEIVKHLFELLNTKCGEDGIRFSPLFQDYTFWRSCPESWTFKYCLEEPEELFNLIESSPEQFQTDCLTFMAVMILKAAYDVASEGKCLRIGSIWLDGIYTQLAESGEELIKCRSPKISQGNDYDRGWKAEWEIEEALMPGAWIGISNEVATIHGCACNADSQNAFYLGPRIIGIHDCDEIETYQHVSGKRFVNVGDIIREIGDRIIGTCLDLKLLEHGFVKGDDDTNYTVLAKIIESNYQKILTMNIDYSHTYNLLKHRN